MGLLMGIVAAGCRPATPVTNRTEASAAASVSATSSSNAISFDPKQVASSARDEMFKTLSGKLVEAMSLGGPAAAIEVCSRDAPKIADQIAKRFGFQIGRTSLKLRNQKNGPPDWVKPIIEEQLTEPRVVELPDGHTGALFPILLKVQCLACHGPKEQISADVQAQLDRLYPNDLFACVSE